MILEAIYNGEFYPSEKVVPTSPAYIEALKTCEKLMEQLCSRKRWSRSRRSMTNETAAGVHYLFCQKIAKQHENMV